MCGIIGYIGSREAFPLLFRGLKKLEYRGYDSAGIAVMGSGIVVVKDAGKVDDVLKGKKIMGNIGIAHTRWATHGGVSRENAHPHTDCSGRVAVVHNGIIENFMEIKEELKKKGHFFRSETDTEVIAHLIEENLGKGYFEAFKIAVGKLEGSYAIVALISPEKKLFFARKKSPLVIGVGNNEFFVASDFNAFLAHTNRVIFVDDGEVGFIDRKIYIERNGREMRKEIKKINWRAEETEKGNFPHFMLKEIYEQPEVIERTLNGELRTFVEDIDEKITVFAAGTSYHAGLAFKYASDIDVEVLLASEFKLYRGGDVLAISQSGETADTLEAVRYAKQKGARIFSLVNVFGSTLSRIADKVTYTKAGPEIGVAATKTFTAQLAALYTVSSLLKGENPPEFDVREALKLDSDMRKLAAEIASAKSMFYIGRGPSYVTALEGALKMKEIAYIHSEGYAGGELKHGPLALIERNVPVVAICPNDSYRERMLGNIEEVKARGAFVIAFGERGDRELEATADRFYPLKPVEEPFSPVQYIIPLQLLAYHTAVLLGRDPDKPRNLAKSVTVE